MNPKKIGLYAVVALAIAVGGYATGRYAAPEKVIVTEKIHEVEKTVVVKVVETDKVLDALKNVTQQKNVHTTKTTIKKPDGTVTTTVTQDDKTKTDSQNKTQEEDKAKSSETATKEVVVEKEVTKTVERARPSWSLALQPGVDVAGALGHGSPYTILPTDRFLLKHAVIGVSVEHRLLGPLSTGIWANTSGAAGLTLRLDL